MTLGGGCSQILALSSPLSNTEMINQESFMMAQYVHRITANENCSDLRSCLLENSILAIAGMSLA